MLVKAGDKKPSEVDISKVWEDYVARRTNDGQFYRNQLIEHYLPLVKFVAQRIQSKLPESVEFGDLCDSAIFGLVDALRDFDPSRNIKFETYCISRVRGAILDEIRTLDWVPRTARIRSHLFDEASSSLMASFGKKPTDEQLMEYLNVNREEFELIKKEAQGKSEQGNYIDLEKEEGPVDYFSTVVDKKNSKPFTERQRKDFKKVLFSGLNKSEKLVLSLYYYEQMTMREIGETIGISESRVSQMHTKLIKGLKERLNKKNRTFDNIPLEELI